jgi:hypothetical protein
VNSIANMAFLDWSENATISATAPATYWPRMSETVGPDRRRRQVFWHALPVGWEQLDYATFLERRRSLVAQVVHDGFRAIGGAPVSREITVQDRIAAGESTTSEFKSTARWNVRAGRQDPKMEHVVVKTVCAFLNGEAVRS